MTASSSIARPGRLQPASSAWLPPMTIALVLGGIVAVRFAATRAGLDPLLVGAAFGAGLAVLAFGARIQGRRRVRTVSSRLLGSTTFGAAVGLALAATAVVAPSIGGEISVPGLGRPAAPFVPWALITILVATAEEGVLRGALLDRLEAVAGLVPAVAVTTAAFALMHVPLYGWHVVPLDLAVGLVLVGLRLRTGRLAAPAAAHVVADLATWWL